MDLEKFERDLRAKYKRSRASDVNKKVASLLSHVNDEWQIPVANLTLHELKIITSTVLDTETQPLHDEVEELLAQKERIERQLERKSDALQHAKYTIFDAIESQLSSESAQSQAKLHQIKFQSIDLFDMLSEMLESALVTTLEKGYDIEETTEEIIKEMTYETLNEGALNTIRLRKILATILQSAIDIAEASPNHATEILRGALRGLRAGLTRAIERFKQQLIYMPDEAKVALIEDFAQLQDELTQVDTLFSQVVTTLAGQSSAATRQLIEQINDDIRYDMEELVHISKETVEVMREHLNQFAKEAMVRSSKMLNSQTAQEAKRMGVQAWSVAKSTIGSAIRNAKDAIDKK